MYIYIHTQTISLFLSIYILSTCLSIYNAFTRGLLFGCLLRSGGRGHQGSLHRYHGRHRPGVSKGFCKVATGLKQGFVGFTGFCQGIS